MEPGAHPMSSSPISSATMPSSSLSSESFFGFMRAFQVSRALHSLPLSALCSEVFVEPGAHSMSSLPISSATVPSSSLSSEPSFGFNSTVSPYTLKSYDLRQKQSCWFGYRFYSKLSSCQILSASPTQNYVVCRFADGDYDVHVDYLFTR